MSAPRRYGEWSVAQHDRTCGCEPDGPRVLALGVLSSGVSCDHGCGLIEVGDKIVCTVCWSEIPVANVVSWSGGVRR
jgi:hypothetical protein